MISDSKGVPVHIHSKMGKYMLVRVYKDKVTLTTHTKRITTSILDVKCFAGGRVDRLIIAEQPDFVNQIISKYRRVRDETVQRLGYQPLETLSLFRTMEIGDCGINSKELVKILTIHGMFNP